MLCKGILGIQYSVILGDAEFSISGVANATHAADRSGLTFLSLEKENNSVMREWSLGSEGRVP